MEMKEETYAPSEEWSLGKGGTQADRDNGFDFIGIPKDWKCPQFIPEAPECCCCNDADCDCENN